MVSLCFFLFNIDRIHLFDIRHFTPGRDSIFDIRFLEFLFSIKLAASAASGAAET
jgi:hypothetical protein